MRRIILSIIIISTIVLGVVKASSAYFSDTETSTNNTLVAGEFDLLVNGENDPEQIVSFDDLKPGDNYIEEKTLTIQNQAYVYLHLIEYESGSGILTEPEELEESATGEKHDLENYLTYDLSIGGETLIAQDDDIPFPDVFSCWIPLGVIEPGDTIVEQSFHFDETVTNWAQGDTLTFSEEYYAEQTRNNDNPTPPDTGSGRVWDNELKRCVDSDPLLWIIGDEETTQTDNPVDELNWTGTFGVFPTPPAIGATYTRIITSPIDDSADQEFPWNSNFGANYGRTIDIDFSYTGPTTNVRLSVGWSPGKSATEQKRVLLDSLPIGTTPNVVGTNTPNWWENMPRRVDTFDFSLTNGSHTITLEHLKGDGALWDFVKLEKI